MKHLLTLRDSDIFPGSEDQDPINFSTRSAVRTVLMNNRGEVAILKVGKGGYHKLPGGGVEESEDQLIALQREILEETGHKVKILKEIGEIIEIKNQQHNKQTSWCWLAVTDGAAIKPEFTAKELANDFSLVWARNLKKAIEIFELDKPADYVGRFISHRDLVFMRAALVLI